MFSQFSNEHPGKILAVGCVTTDLILSTVESLPPPGVLRSVDHFSMHIGGCASNAAIDLARLGLQSSLACKVGKDVFGDFVLSTCRKEGVNTAPSTVDETVFTTVSTVAVRPDGERSFLYHGGSTSALTDTDISDESLEEADFVFIAGAMILDSLDGEPAMRLMKRAKEMGKITVMDTAYDSDEIWLNKVRPALRYMDLFMPSEVEAVNMTGGMTPEAMAKAFHELGAKNVVIKLGSKGAYISPENEPRFYSPSFKVTPVDTTGAGDAFCAGFLAALSTGKTFQEAGVMGNALGALCVTKIGATTGIPSMEEVEEFIKTHEVNELLV